VAGFPAGRGCTKECDMIDYVAIKETISAMRGAARAKMEEQALAGVCDRCGGDMEPEILTHPVTGETKVMILCPKCRKEYHQELVERGLLRR